MLQFANLADVRSLLKSLVSLNLEAARARSSLRIVLGIRGHSNIAEICLGTIASCFRERFAPDDTTIGLTAIVDADSRDHTENSVCQRTQIAQMGQDGRNVGQKGR